MLLSTFYLPVLQGAPQQHQDFLLDGMSSSSSLTAPIKVKSVHCVYIVIVYYHHISFIRSLNHCYLIVISQKYVFDKLKVYNYKIPPFNVKILYINLQLC